MPDTATRIQIARWPALVGAVIAGMLLIPDNRIVFLAIWGVGAVVVYGRVFARRRRRWLRYHDPRSYRDLVAAIGLLLTAVCCAAAIALVLFGPAGTGIRGFATALALGAFVAVGIVMDDDEPDIR